MRVSEDPEAGNNGGHHQGYHGDKGFPLSRLELSELSPDDQRGPGTQCRQQENTEEPSGETEGNIVYYIDKVSSQYQALTPELEFVKY